MGLGRVKVVGRERQDQLLELLNSTPVVDGEIVDRLADPGEAKAWQRAHGGSGSAEERRHLARTRDVLQRVVRQEEHAQSLADLLTEVALRPDLSDQGVSWELEAPAQRRIAVEAVLTWAELQETMPGRLRSCANPDCRLFLIDRSKGNAARWCSMAVCGNRMKARRHYQRTRD